MSAIPQLDLSRAAARIEAELAQRWRRLLARTAFVGGDEVAEFERAFATFLELPEALGVANGTDALVLALRALDLAPGDEVIVPAFTFIATAAAVRLTGGTPVFADVEPVALNLDVASAATKVGPRTVGIIPVHLYGRPCDLDAVAALAERHHLWTIEDAAQAHGARWRGRRVGGFGRLATWSFYPSKNLGCFGDGGALTGEPALLARARLLANHGRTAHYEHAEVGTNSRLDALQAAVLNCRLARLEADNARRRQIAGRYRAALTGLEDLRLLDDAPHAEPVYHQLTVLTSRRDALKGFLAERGIGTAVHYPLPLHRQLAFRDAAAPDELPVAERAAREVLCLPMFPELTDGEVDRVCAAVHEFFGGSALA
jgi:dTDP-3-amino-3,4,6-trideoxy-alpha-D-glucose transaminase